MMVDWKENKGHDEAQPVFDIVAVGHAYTKRASNSREIAFRVA
jgi:hypothetical protein